MRLIVAVAAIMITRVFRKGEAMKQLDDTVSLDGSNATAEQIRDILVDGANIAWRLGGNDGQMTVYANFVALLIQEHDRMKAERDEYRSALFGEMVAKPDEVSP